jgi:antirestriction protein
MISIRKHHNVVSITGHAPWSVLYCASCVTAVLPGLPNVTNHLKYNWAVIVQCPRCHLCWIVCTMRSKARKPLLLHDDNEICDISDYIEVHATSDAVDNYK